MMYILAVLSIGLRCIVYVFCFFFFKQKTAYEMRISDWSSDVCSSDLRPPFPFLALLLLGLPENTGRGIARRRWSDEPAFGVGRHLLQMVHRTLRRRHGICRPDQLRLHPAGYFFLKIGCCTRHEHGE